jgi:uncharacterized protein
MNRQLLDVNVLLALLWPRHEGHRAAHAWFEKSGRRAWATNPLTQLGVLRLLTNPTLTRGAVNAGIALDTLIEATRQEGHQFWPLERELAAGLEPFAARLRGHRQWTDAVLLGQVTDRDGLLVTFDSGIRELAGRESRERILLLKRN